MSTAQTGIEWTDRTWNPVRGCSRVSEGCRNCYAEKVAARFSDKGQAFHLFADRNKSGSKWTGKVELVESALTEPLKWRKPVRIFVNSMSDLFHENLPDEAIDRVFAVMALCPQHTFQLLTKRAERMRKYFACDDMEWRDRMEEAGDKIAGDMGWCFAEPENTPRPLPNVWLGVSVEGQPAADARIPELLQTPAAVRFVSYEPALEAVNFEKLGLCRDWRDGTDAELPRLHWLIAGGESGPSARPAHPQWFRDVRDQCVAAGVTFFFKQWGEHLPTPIDRMRIRTAETRLIDIDGNVRAATWDDVSRGGRELWTVGKIGKKKAGALLDGREWREMPGRVG